MTMPSPNGMNCCRAACLLSPALWSSAAGIGHLILLVATTKGDLVPDNLTETIRTWQIRGFPGAGRSKAACGPPVRRTIAISDRSRAMCSARFTGGTQFWDRESLGPPPDTLTTRGKSILMDGIPLSMSRTHVDDRRSRIGRAETCVGVILGGVWSQVIMTLSPCWPMTSNRNGFGALSAACRSISRKAIM
jgi:hypothetical protein